MLFGHLIRPMAFCYRRILGGGRKSVHICQAEGDWPSVCTQRSCLLGTLFCQFVQYEGSVTSEVVA